MAKVTTAATMVAMTAKVTTAATAEAMTETVVREMMTKLRTALQFAQ